MSLKPANRLSETSSSANRKARLELLKQEAQSIKSQIEVNSIDPTVLMVNSDIFRLQDQSDTYKKKIELEKQKINDLKSQIDTLNKEIETKRKNNLENSIKNKAISDASNKKIKSLENKIDKGLQKLNEILATNKSLIEKIDKVRRERMIYMNMRKQLESELSKKQDEMKQIIETSNQAIKEREETKKKLNELKLEAEKENEEFEFQWRTLEKLIIRDGASKDFITENEKKDSKESESGFSIEAELEDRVESDKFQIEVHNEKLRKYREELDTLTYKTGLPSLKEIVDKYLESEMQNFSLFNHVNELSSEMEQLDQQITEIRIKINKHKAPDVSIDVERKNLIKDYQLKLERLALKEEELNRVNERTKKTLSSLVEGARVLCERIGIEYEDISEKNLISLFAEIEKKIDDRVFEKRFKNFEANIDNIKKIEIDAPMFIERDEDEELAIPMTTDEVRYKSLKKINEENDKRYKRK